MGTHTRTVREAREARRARALERLRELARTQESAARLLALVEGHDQELALAEECDADETEQVIDCD